MVRYKDREVCDGKKKVHTVIRRVFEGGAGVISGGMEERSIERGDCVPPDMGRDTGLDEVDSGGDCAAIVVA